MTAAAALAVMMMLAGAAEAETPCAASVQPLITSFERCVQLSAWKLEVSGESASDVATASLNACIAYRNAFHDEASKCLPPDLVNKLTDHLTEAARQLAIGAVVERRAKQNSN